MENVDYYTLEFCLAMTTQFVWNTATLNLNL